MSGGLYGGPIKELAATPSVPETLESPDRRVSVDNPFCGDRVDLEARLDGECLGELALAVRGCMLCQASANVMASAVIGLSVVEIEAVSERLAAMLKGEGEAVWPPPGWEPLIHFEPVRKHKSRHSCLLLPFSALLEALG
jgi:nitrogen fixation NifU-like protein